MKRNWIWFVLLILSFTFGVAFTAFALEKGEKHADPYKVMTKGQVVGQLQMDKNNANGYLLIAYQGEMYRCYDLSGNTYSCVLLVPDIN